MNPFEARDIWPPGTVVDRKYIIDATLGRGSFGTAYRAHHRVLARIFVIKRLHSQYAEDENYVQKFITEARAIERLRGCPQIVEIFDMTQTEDGHLILVMEHMVGGDLETLMRRTGKFRVEDSVWYALQIAEGLAAAHANGLIHRDVKPENVLLGADPRIAKLADFGIAADRDTSSPTSVLRGGSIGYAAPEQWHMAGKFLDGRADLYPLGVTLFRLLAGYMPFGELDIGEWIERVRTTRATPLRSIRPDVPEALEHLVDELLAFNRDQRPASAGIVIERLKALNFPPMPSAQRLPTLEESNPPRPSPGPIPSPVPSPVPSPSPVPPPPVWASPAPSPSPQPQPPQPFNPLLQTQPQPQPQPYYQPPSRPMPMPLPLPPAPVVPSRRGGFMWAIVLLPIIVIALGVGAMWYVEHRPAKENPLDGLTYQWIPGGKFTMGCPTDEVDCYPNERPAHTVTLTEGFYLSQTETTVAAYKRFSEATRTPMPPEPTWRDRSTNEVRSMNPGFGSLRSPISMVSFDEATKYCEWIGGRLPTEAEWEYAARAGSTGLRYGNLNDIAWYGGNSGSQRIDALEIFKNNRNNYEAILFGNNANFHTVASRAPNAFGLYDMIGNVWEWVSDPYSEKYYASSPSRNPTGPAVTGAVHIGRGGSYYTEPRRASATARSNQPQADDEPKPYRNQGFGFRCVWNAPLF